MKTIPDKHIWSLSLVLIENKAPLALTTKLRLPCKTSPGVEISVFLE